MLFHLYIILTGIILAIELIFGIMASSWLKHLIDATSKVLLFVSCIPSALAIFMAELGSIPISLALAIVSIVVAVYGLCHKMTNVDATAKPTQERK